jgi:hypothetical protein
MAYPVDVALVVDLDRFRDLFLILGLAFEERFFLLFLVLLEPPGKGQGILEVDRSLVLLLGELLYAQLFIKRDVLGSSLDQAVDVGCFLRLRYIQALTGSESSRFRVRSRVSRTGSDIGDLSWMASSISLQA